MNKKFQVYPETKGLIFDLDGTLVDSMPLHFEAWREVCLLKGLEFDETEFYALAGVPSDRIFEIINERHGTDFDPKAMSHLKEDTYIKKIAQVKPIQQVLYVVRQYHGKIPMSVGTGSPRAHSLETLKASGLNKYFDILVSKDDVAHGKPNPETFLKCAQAMNIAPELCQVFEDGDLGLEAAQAAGMMSTDVRPLLNRK